MLRESKALFPILTAHGNITTVARAILAVGLQSRDHVRHRQEKAGTPATALPAPHFTQGLQEHREVSYWNMKWEPELANTNTPTLPPFREHPLSTLSAPLPRRQHYTTRKTEVKSQREAVGETSRENTRYSRKMASSFSCY